VILIDARLRHDWLLGSLDKRLREKLAKQPAVNLQGSLPYRKPKTADVT
jgi:hypothetical protein